MTEPAPDTKPVIPLTFSGTPSGLVPSQDEPPTAVTEDDIEEQIEPPAKTPPAANAGFPPNTALADMTAEEQVAYWRDKAQKHEDRSKANAAELRRLRREQLSDPERALEDARSAGRSEAFAELAPKLAASALAAAGVPTEIVEDLDLSRFLTESLEVDADKVSGLAAKYAGLSKPGTTPPAGSADGGPQGVTPTDPTLDDRIEAAQKAGDFKTVISLQNQKLIPSATS